MLRIKRVRPLIELQPEGALYGISIYKTNVIASHPSDAGTMLKKYGCVVVPCIAATELPEIQESLKADIFNYPEYRGNGVTAAQATVTILPGDGRDYQIDVEATERAPSSTYVGRVVDAKHIEALRKSIAKWSNRPLTHVLGSFQAHGNAASFHCDSARRIRDICYRTCHKLFATASASQMGPGPWFIEMNYDRIGVRKAGTKIDEDSDMWHRDITPGLGNDSMFGGWINLDSKDQRFICDLGSHLAKPDGSGFHREQPAGQANSIRIPPGHCVIFYQHILHAVAPSNYSVDSYRQYISWRLTTSKVPFDNKRDVWEKQLVPRTPSGQDITVTSANHRSALLWSHTIAWSVVTFKDEYLDRKVGKNGSIYYLPKSPMYLRPTMRDYSAEEKSILIPQPI